MDVGYGYEMGEGLVKAEVRPGELRAGVFQGLCQAGLEESHE